MKKRAILIFLFLIFLFLFFLILSNLYLPLKEKSSSPQIFQVKKGQGAFEIAKNLKKERLIKSEFSFLLYLVLKGKTKSLQAGYYLLSPSMTPFEIAQKLIEGDVIFEKITIVEGENKNEIAEYLEEKGILKKENFLEKIKLKYWREKYEFLKDVKAEDLEGFLFPDTYFVKKGETEEEIISKFLDNFDKKVNEKLREEISEKGKSLYDILILASLLEKEVKTFEDKKLVAGILWKRLENEIPLQVDATITFITGKKTIKIPAGDLKIDSPYNTYKYKGLPPTPICNPGLESILAAISPQQSDYWYYLTTPEGNTIFSKTLKEHNIAKAKYLR